jgi:conjugal transfer/entry exclusion protein
MKKFWQGLAILVVLFVCADTASAQTKQTKKATKKAAKVMCGCTALKELSAVMKTVEANPDAATAEVMEQVTKNIAKAQGCVDDLTAISNTVPEVDKAYFSKRTEELMEKKCPEMVKLLNEK